MKCAKCGKEVGNLFCAKCKAEIEGTQPKIETGKLFPLIYWDAEHKLYLFGCTVRGCPCNHGGICITKHLLFPKNLLHDFDGDNIIQQNCG